MTALDNAIRIAGSANKLAVAIGVSGMAVSQWKTKGTVPSSRVLQVFKATGVSPMNFAPIYTQIPLMGCRMKRLNHAIHQL